MLFREVVVQQVIEYTFTIVRTISIEHIDCTPSIENDI